MDNLQHQLTKNLLTILQDILQLQKYTLSQIISLQNKINNSLSAIHSNPVSNKPQPQHLQPPLQKSIDKHQINEKIDNIIQNTHQQLNHLHNKKPSKPQITHSKTLQKKPPIPHNNRVQSKHLPHLPLPIKNKNQVTGKITEIKKKKIPENKQVIVKQQISQKKIQQFNTYQKLTHQTIQKKQYNQSQNLQILSHFIPKQYQSQEKNTYISFSKINNIIQLYKSQMLGYHQKQYQKCSTLLKHIHILGIAKQKIKCKDLISQYSQSKRGWRNNFALQMTIFPQLLQKSKNLISQYFEKINQEQFFVPAEIKNKILASNKILAKYLQEFLTSKMTIQVPQKLLLTFKHLYSARKSTANHNQLLLLKNLNNKKINQLYLQSINIMIKMADSLILSTELSTEKLKLLKMLIQFSINKSKRSPIFLSESQYQYWRTNY